MTKVANYSLSTHNVNALLQYIIVCDHNLSCIIVSACALCPSRSFRSQHIQQPEYDYMKVIDMYQLFKTIFHIASYGSAHKLWQVLYFHQQFSRVIFSHTQQHDFSCRVQFQFRIASFCGDQERDYDVKILVSFQHQSFIFH